MNMKDKSSAPEFNNNSNAGKRSHARRSFSILAALACVLFLAAVSLAGLPGSWAALTNSSQPQGQSSQASKTHGGVDLSGKSPDELAAYVFENHGCKSCHTMGQGGKLGFTDRGKEVGKNFEGCISLLTSMNVIAQVKPANRSADDKVKAARFQQFGCTTCHQITPGKLGLTEEGKKLKSMHMACTDVERILAK
jgi:cytochrome c551/c552